MLLLKKNKIRYLQKKEEKNVQMEIFRDFDQKVMSIFNSNNEIPIVQCYHGDCILFSVCDYFPKPA